jgi:aerobic-type carbon monoxide dehydrogenase small subunit (CoxS/CutS family)
VLAWVIQAIRLLHRPAAGSAGARNHIAQATLRKQHCASNIAQATLRSDVMISIKVNGTSHQLDVEGDTPLLWVLREEIGLTGTKFGCGIAQCGACTVHVNGEAMRSCSVQVGSVEGAEIITIEGLSSDSTHPVQQAWLTEQVPQCGYCQSGQIMATTAFLKAHPNPTDADIDSNLTNICRCGTYERLRRAVHRAAALMRA